MSDTSSTSSTVIESPPPPPVPFEEDEDVALVNAWVRFAYGPHFGEELRGDTMIEVLKRGF